MDPNQTQLTFDPNVKNVQTFLNANNFNAGPVDGLFGPKTSAGVSAFQTKANIPVTGQIDQATRQAIANFKPQIPSSSFFGENNTVDVQALNQSDVAPVRLATPVAPSFASQEMARAQEFVNNLSPRIEALTGQADQTTQLIQQLLGSNQSAQVLEAERQAGLPELRNQLVDIQGQISQEIASLRAGQQALANQGDVRVTGTLSRRQEQLEQQATNRVLGLQASAQVLQGNIANAEATIARMAEIETESRANALQSAMFNLEQIQKEAERLGNLREARLAEARKVQIAEQERLLEEEKAERTNARSIAIEALSRGADYNQVSQFIASNPTVDRAIELFGQALQTPTREEQLAITTEELNQQLLRERINTERAQRYTIASDTATDTLLSRKEIVDMTKLPEVGKLESRAVFVDLLNQYRNKINETGIAVRGEEKGQLESILGELQIAYKNAAELGALVGADFELLDRVIPNATADNFAEKAIRQIRRQGVSQIVGSLDETITRNKQGVADQLRRIEAIDPRYLYTDYLDVILEPITSIETTATADPFGVFRNETQSSTSDGLGIR